MNSQRLASKLADLQKKYAPTECDTEACLLVGVYFGDKTDPYKVAFIGPVRVETRVEAKDRFSEALIEENRPLIGVFVMAYAKDTFPCGSAEVTAEIAEHITLEMIEETAARALAGDGSRVVLDSLGRVVDDGKRTIN